MIPLFLHLPKTGGTSLNHCVYDQYFSEEPDRGEEDLFFKEGIYYYPTGFFAEEEEACSQEVRAILARAEVRAVVGHFAFGVHRYLRAGADYRYLTLLRRPAARVASLYRHVVHFEEPDPGLHREVVEGGVTLHEFATTFPLPELENDQTRRIAGNRGPCTRADLERAKRRIVEDFTFAGLTERFDESVVLMKRKLGWKKPLQYYPENVSADWGVSVEQVDEKTAAAIEERNGFDLELYAVAEELLEEARQKELASGFEEEVKDFQEHNRKMREEWRSVEKG